MHTASYDAFSIIPSLINNPPANTIILLQLIKTFNSIYSNTNNINHRLLFILTSGSFNNYQGDKYLLRNLDNKIVDLLQFVICIDYINVNSMDNLYLHVSKSGTNNELIKSVYNDIYLSTASDMDINLIINHKKINISNPSINFPHQLYAKKRINSVTLSNHLFPSNIYNNTIITNSNPNINMDILIKYIKFFSKIVYKHVTNDHNANLSDNSIIIDHASINTWLVLFNNTRHVIYLDNKNNMINRGMEQYFNKQLIDSKHSIYAFDGNFKFYNDSANTNHINQLVVYKPRSFMIDLYLSVMIAIYLLLIHLLITGPKNFAQFKAAFS